MNIVKAETFTSFPEETLKEVKFKYGLRRADRFTVLATAAVKMAFSEQFPQFLPPETGLITASSFGPHKTVFANLDDILDYPEDQILPTKFSHSVHNAVTSYLGTILRITGPAFAITNFENPIDEAMNLAETLLVTGLCETLLLIAVEEEGLLTQNVAPLWQHRSQKPLQEAVSVFLATT
ncbi:MAG: beta-ketoacyl synthase chain length factor [Victivallales bacterium]|nr:beta-ketoacyl synthase chain length factor [Victivallales bacterium]